MAASVPHIPLLQPTLCFLAPSSGHPPPPPPRGAPGALPPGFFPPTFCRRSELFHDSHLVRLGKAAAWPRGEDAPCAGQLGRRGDALCPAPLPLGEASNFPTEPRASSSLAGLAGTPSWPSRGCSAHGEDAGWHRLIILGCGGASHHGDGRPRHLVFLPAAPADRRGASSAPKGFSPSFWGSLGTEGGLSPDRVGSAHLRFHPPAAASHEAGDDQQREPCGKRRGRR